MKEIAARQSGSGKSIALLGVVSEERRGLKVQVTIVQKFVH